MRSSNLLAAVALLPAILYTSATNSLLLPLLIWTACGTIRTVHEVVREVGGDLIEEAVLTDAFTHPKTGRTSHCYRINYRATDRSLTNQEVDEMQFRVRDLLTQRLGLELR